MAKKQRKSSDSLSAYRGKRSAEHTTEPFRSAPASHARTGLFVVQKHAARAMHYDFRLELDGVLLSWAVPKGPSLDPSQKRLAVHVEDHPLDYADFEGVIPEGNYGAGAVIVWDIGRWEAVEEPRAGMVNGKLLFDLFGYKLRGRWTIFRTKGGGDGRQWLMVKKPDAAASTTAPPEQSVRSGRTVEELRDGIDGAAGLRRKIARRKLPAWPRSGPPEPMLAQPRETPFSRPGWLFEIKYDGYRLFGVRDEDKVQLRYRRGSDSTAAFPEVADALRALPHEQLVIDGELVALDEAGHPSFERLQQRVHLKRSDEIRRAAFANPVTYFVFDFLAFEGADLRTLPLVERKALLRELLPPAGPLRFCDHIEEQGEAMYDAAQRMGLEGIVGKRADSPYRPGRSDAWIKVRADRVGDFAVVGYSPPEGSRSGFGALHLAVCDGDTLRYAGRVGSGFTGDDLSRLHAALDAERRRDPPCVGEVPKGRGHVWVEPRHVVEVRYKERTNAGQLRQPVFLRERDRQVGRGLRAPGLADVRATASAARARGDRARRARGHGHEPEEGVLARRGVHEGRPRPVLPIDRSVAPAVPRGPPARAHALPRWHPGQELLPEGCAGFRARLDPHRAHVERARPARDRVLRVRERARARVPREPRDDPAAPVVEPRRGAPAPRTGASSISIRRALRSCT